MQEAYKVQYAGLPETQQSILADSQRRAALQFLSLNIARNTIIVKQGFASEAFFSFDDLSPDLPEELKKEVPLLTPPEKERKPLPFWKEYLYRLLTWGPNRLR